MVTAFAGPKAAEAFLYHVNWRWGFGCFCIVLPVIAAPLYILFSLNLRKAKKTGVLVESSSNRTFLQTLKWGLIEFDGKHIRSATRKPEYKY